MDNIHLIDAFPPFLVYWQNVRDKPLNEQIEAWATEYMAQWPELLTKQIEAYTQDGFDWVKIASERVFPYLDKRLPEMKTAHQYLSVGIKELLQSAGEALGVDSPVWVVIYAGIGCGAGWVTTYQGQPAILFGLENIAEEGWSQPDILAGLAAHEFGHLAHFHWRERAGLPHGRGPWWQLYCEGFAQYCEHLITGRQSWHMGANGPDDWLAWCRQHKGWLANQFLARAASIEATRPFFGSWYDIQGYKQTGYYLGHEAVGALIAQSDIKQVATLDDYETRLKEVLVKIGG